MSQRLYVFFNRGKDFEPFYEHAREAYGDVELVALVPRGYVASEAERDGAEVREVGGRGAGMLFALIRDALRIRRERPDLFIIFFESLKLRIFAAASGPRRVVWWRGKEASLDLPPSVPATVLEHTRIRGRGLWSLAKMYSNIYLRRFPLR